MANTDNAATTTDRKAIAKREWINAAGERVVTGSPDATAARYTFLANGKAVEFTPQTTDYATRCTAIMGWLTKVGNVVNSVVNADDYDGSDPMETAADWNAEFLAGQWREPGDGPRGPKYDNAVLADALFAVGTAKGKVSGDSAYYLNKLATDKKYRAQVLTVTEIMDKYKALADERGLTKAPTRTADDVL